MALHRPPSGAKVKKPAEEKATEENKAHAELANRVVGGAVVTVAIVGGILMGGWVWSIVASVIAIGSLWELYQMMYKKFRLSRAWGLVGGALMLFTVSLGLGYAVTLSILTLTAFLILFTEVVRRESTGESYALWNMGGTLAGMIYVVLPWSFLIYIRSLTWGYVFLFTVFFCTWSCDVGAYLIGSKFGEKRFCPRVSPKKSWEGFFAGALASTVCGALLARVFEFPPIPLLLLGLICGIAGQIGDLGESVLKREAEIKDSGNIIPGHGGFLDRFDSILINATLAFFIFEVLG